MWDALKSHIMKERQRKKQEQEQDAAIERMRKERENKQKQDVMTLEETKEQISQLEQKLEQLREDKHQLFLQLKKVLNEDETRRKARENDSMGMSHYQPPSVQMGGHPNMFMQTGPISSRSPMYKVGPTPQQNLISSGSLKRQRSPSPTPSGYNQPFSYKVQAMPSYPQKHNQYPSSQPTHYYGHPANQPHSTTPTTYPTGSQPAYSYAGHGQYPQSSGPSTAQSPQGPTNATDQTSKHLQHGYHIQHVQQGYLGQMHQTMDHPQKPTYQEEKYYTLQQHTGVPVRGMTTMHHAQAMIPIQPQSKVQQGSITTGYPIRSQPPPPPPPQTSSNYPVPTSTPHNAYTAQQTGSRHGYITQPPPGRYY